MNRLFRAEQSGPVHPQNPGHGLRCFECGLPTKLILVKGPLGDPRRGGQCLEGAGVNFSRRHDPSLDDSSKVSSVNIHLGDLDGSSNTEGMKKPWPQNARFRELVDALVASGTSEEAQAEGIGITHSSFVTWYSSKDREPGKKTLRLLCAYYSVPLADLTDDPGAAVDGHPLSTQSPMDRHRFTQMIQMVKELNLTEEDKNTLFKEYIRDAKLRAKANQKSLHIRDKSALDSLDDLSKLRRVGSPPTQSGPTAPSTLSVSTHPFPRLPGAPRPSGGPHELRLWCPT